jgi:hypothetical protein
MAKRRCSIKDCDNLAPAILAAAFAVTLLGVAPWEAHATPDDDWFGCLPGPSDCAYISALQRDGIPTATGPDVFAVGERVCKLLDRGKTVDDVNPVIVADAHKYLCPDAGVRSI